MTTKKMKDEEVKRKEVVLHIHGGGFIAMSSKSHQIYTRVLARDTNYPIFSVDYRLAPEHPYPDGLEDCWNVYSWLVKYSKINLNLDASQIILMGDSAGGNLVAALTALAIQNKFQVPHKLILVYPALSLAKSLVFPSVFYSMADPVLNTSFLKMCFASYLDLEKHDPEEDFCISPLMAPDNILCKFNPAIFT